MLASDISSAEDNSLRKTLLIGSLLAVMILVVYWPVQSFDFVYDDDLYVARNRHVQEGLTLDGLRWSFTTFHAGNWHPLTWLSHMADVEIHRFDAGGHHWTSVQIHAAAAILLFFVLSGMTNSPWASALVAALFAIHPLHVESVAWVSERKDVLSGLFWILTMGAYVYYVRHPSILRYLLVLGSFSLGLLSKPMVVTLPFVLLLLDYWPLDRYSGAATVFVKTVSSRATPGRSAALQLLAEKIPLILLVVPSCIVTVMAQNSVGALLSLEKISVGERIANAIVSYMAYIGKAVWPVDLAVLYPHAGVPPVWEIAVASLLLMSISCVAVVKAREIPFLTVGWLWYLGTLVPVIGLVQVGSQSMADRYTYIPLMGLYIAVAWGAKSLQERYPGSKQPVRVGLLIVLTGMLLLTRIQIMTWNNGITLFENAIAATTVNPVAHNNAGVAYMDRNDCGKAVPHFLKAIEQKSDYASAYNNLGVCAARANRAENALQCFAQAIAADPLFTKPRIERGLLWARLQRYDEAKDDLLQVLRIDPTHDGAHTNLGLIFVQQGKLGDAEAHLREALRVNPRNAEALNNLGLVRMKQGQAEEAVASFLRAREFAPGNPVIEANLKAASDKQQKDTSGKGAI